ncbi:MAG: hypothetical protein QOI00_1772, partial [Chloroflexota bacterium]|nr:hypothetical protein [Chloroflexota bacterium]
VAAHGPGDGYTVNVLRTGPTQDEDLVNAWGLSRGPSTPWWVADNGTNVSTLYLADGTKLATPRVPIPAGAPTGTVFNGVTTDFNGDNFLFDGEAGVIFGWRGGLGLTHAAEVLNDQFQGDAVFKGLAIGTVGSTQYLYATDFHNRRIDVFGSTSPFAEQGWVGAFHDPELPAGYGPFGIQNLTTPAGPMLFVTYAKTQSDSNDERAGQGRGVVDAFATDGRFLARVATHGQLNAPWGLALAPTDFGRFSGDLLVGNFGDGQIHAYRWQDDHWRFDGELRGSNGQPLVIDGLWALAFGGGVKVAVDGNTNDLFYTAGPNEEAGGAFGTITANTP